MTIKLPNISSIGWIPFVPASIDGRVAAQVCFDGLKPKELYSWRWILARHGLQDDCPAENQSGFVRAIASAKSSGMTLLLPHATREC